MVTTRSSSGLTADREGALVRSLLAGIAVLRAVAWAWLAVVLVVSREDLARPAVALALAAAALAVTVWLPLRLRGDHSALLRPAALAVELAVAVALTVGDGLAYDGPHDQSLGSAWPLAGILTAGVALGPRGGAAAGALVGLGRWVGAAVLGLDAGAGPSTLSVISTMVLYAMAGGVAGFATARLRDAERRVAVAQAREEVARTLHDGVLQTLAVVQRRADDDIARLARDQERELREYLFGTDQAVGGGDLGSRLRHAGARFEQRFEGRVTVVVADDLPEVRPDVLDALAGAVTEALTNAGKHGAARQVTVYAEPDDAGDGVFCSVNDDGSGFDPGAVSEGIGLARSIRGRLAEVGGTVELESAPGRGTELRLVVPG